ncbi:Type 1 glutamine amidotransferase-like domain-containing protein [Paenibacillus lactis]|uniref:Type 1 glutamine amidotransferase-like domain-containing protein n=1 Tax=Paenibacillus lactis TaxID=228574 RepID=UPI0021B5E966
MELANIQLIRQDHSAVLGNGTSGGRRDETDNCHGRCVTDPQNGPLYKLNGLGLLAGSHCPHYDGESKRRPAYHDLILQGEVQPGYAADDGAALHFIDGRLHGVVSSRPNAKAYRVERSADAVEEHELQVKWLG